jgi:DNA polymerase
MNNLDELKSKALVCQQCPLHKTRTNVVWGEGNEDANIMLIGEAPGKNEDIQGRPFVGRSGKLLDQLLAEKGLSREKNVFIANIVKCRPPENRKPIQEEKETCLPYLLKQIDIMRPDMIVLLGATALNALIDEKAKISKVRGNWIEWRNGVWVMPTFHPSALLRNPKLKELERDDFAKVAAKEGINV